MSLHSSSFCSSKLPYLILHLRKIKSEISACDVPPNAGQAVTEVGIQKKKACTVKQIRVRWPEIHHCFGRYAKDTFPEAQNQVERQLLSPLSW